MKILILESEPEMKETMSKLLERYDIEVIDLCIDPLTIGEGILEYHNSWEGLNTNQMLEELQNLRNLTSTKDEVKNCVVSDSILQPGGSVYRQNVMPIARCDFGTISESKEPTWPTPKGRKDRNKSLKK